MQTDSSPQSEERTLHIGAAHFAVVGGNRSVLYAAQWLGRLGASLEGAGSVEAARALDSQPLAILAAGDALDAIPPRETQEGATEIYLWDYEVGRPGIGAFACAVSGVSTVIGMADGPPGVLPANIPEKWAGILGASLALSLHLARSTANDALPRRIDVSAADVLRAYAEQNSGNHAGVPYGWRRNGRTAVEHGGVFPQGFFRCRDGFVAVQARSRQDWQAILAALGQPEWSKDPAFSNPFKLSMDDTKVMPRLDEELTKYDRSELLDRAIETGAPMAPVLSLDEAGSWDVFRTGFIDQGGRPRAPFTVVRGG
jgi:hypothetical protein